MSETKVEHTLYYCYECQRLTENITEEDSKCLSCLTGFVEELEEDANETYASPTEPLMPSRRGRRRITKRRRRKRERHISEGETFYVIRLKHLERVKITEKEANQDLPCSVCFESYKLHESGIKLPCDHLFHDSCIAPWLKLHSTCPVCRESSIQEKKTDVKIGPSLVIMSVSSMRNLITTVGLNAIDL